MNPIIGITVLMIISLLCFAGLMPTGTVPGFIVIIALILYASLMFIL